MTGSSLSKASTATWPDQSKPKDLDDASSSYSFPRSLRRAGGGERRGEDQAAEGEVAAAGSSGRGGRSGGEQRKGRSRQRGASGLPLFCTQAARDGGRR
jgi:hypothetical protein